MGDRVLVALKRRMPTIGGISWFMLFYVKCNGPLVGTYNIWSEVSLKFLVLKRA